MTANTSEATNWLCEANCFYYKPNRKEDQRCRGYHVAQILTESRPELRFELVAEAFDRNYQNQLLLNHICSNCPFYIEDCDFTSFCPPQDCLPCGGLVFISNLLKLGKITEQQLKLADLKELGDKSYVRLTNNSCVKRLEENYIYHIARDELYEINQEALDFVTKCDGTTTISALDPDREFLEFCVSEDLIQVVKEQTPRALIIGKSPIPSLRYLEWLITSRCNISCAHCYLGESDRVEYKLELIRPLLDEFTSMQGLRVLVSGGEPTLYEHFSFLNNILPEYPVRSVLLTNGIIFNKDLVKQLNFHEIQISLDGMEKGHDAIRGKGNFRKAVRAMELVRQAGIDLSVATMVHRLNLSEWDTMKDLVESMGAREWSVDYPCAKGRWNLHPELKVELREAADRMRYAFGGSYHGKSAGWTCGRHLIAVLPTADICKCGLFPQNRLGSVQTGLANAWARMTHLPIAETDCAGCESADICGGGCRFRAGSTHARDEVMCLLHKGSI